MVFIGCPQTTFTLKKCLLSRENIYSNVIYVSCVASSMKTLKSDPYQAKNKNKMEK